MHPVNLILLSLVEGVTEFLPVSSTFHLLQSARLLQIQQTEFVSLFTVVIQSGAILGALVLYGRRMATNRELLKKLAISFVPTMIVGLILHKIIKQVLFYQSTATIILFILIGVSFLLIELYLKKRPPVKEVSNLSYRQALLVGIAQSFAVVPGVSRAGAVLICMLLQGYKRDEAAEYSFMLGVPTILASGIFDLYSSREVFVGHMDYVGYLLVGSILAGIVAYAVMRLLVRYLQSHTLALFGWYRIIMGSILLIV